MIIYGQNDSARGGRRCLEIQPPVAGWISGNRPFLRPSSVAKLLRRVDVLRALRGSSVRGSLDGFTLIELIVTIVVIGIVLLALVMSFQESLKAMERQKDLRKSVVLCEDLMNEIRSKQYADPQSPTNFGPEEALRRDFDDVDDYDVWSEMPPTTIEGVTLTNYADFTRRVIVVNVTSNFNGAPMPDNSTVFKRITVIVSNAVMAVSNVSVVSQYD